MDFQGADRSAVVSEVIKRWTNLTSVRTEKLTLWQECQLAKDNKFGDTFGEIAENRSHRYIPTAHQSVEAAWAQAMQGTVNNDRFFKVLGRTPTDQNAVPSLEAKIRWDFYRMNWRSTFGNLLKSAHILGNVPWTVVWRTEKAVVPDEEMFKAKEAAKSMGIMLETNEHASLGYPTKFKTTFEGPQLVYGHPGNYVQDRAPDDPRFAFRIYRSNQTAEYLQAKWNGLKDENGKDIYVGLDDVENGRYGQSEISDNLQREIDQAKGFTSFPDDKVELLTFCGDLNVPGEGYFHNVFGVIANRSILLRFCSNPFAHGLPPWQMFTLTPDPNDPFGYGTGIIEPTLGLVDMVNVRANQVADANALAITPPKIINPHIMLAGSSNVAWGPGATFLARDVSAAIRTMEVSKDSLQLGMNEINFYLQQIATTTSSQGAVTGQGEAMSATQASGVQAQGNAILTERFRHIKDNLVIPILKMHTSLNQQLMSPENPVLIRLEVDEQGQAINLTTGEPLPVGKNWAEVSFSDIQGEFDFEVVAGDEVAKSQQQVRDQLQFVQTLSQDPEFKAYIDKPGFLKDATAGLGWTTAYKWIKTNEQVQLEQQQAQQQAAQQQMGNPGSPDGQAQSQPPGSPKGVPSVPGNPGSGGSPARTPYPEQLAGPSGSR